MVEEIASAGVIIHCKSSSVDRFKLVLFDKEGSIRNIGESDAKKNHSVAELFFVPFQKISVKKLSVIAAIMGDRKVPYEFHSLDTLEVQGAHKLESGEHILCVYGDNFFQSVKYELNLLPLNGSCSTNISQISHIEQQLINKKKALGEFQKEYMGVKIAYETELLKGRKQREKEMFDILKIDYSAANERLRAENRCLTGLLKEREEHYAKLIDNCRSPDNRVDSLNRRKSLCHLYS